MSDINDEYFLLIGNYERMDVEFKLDAVDMDKPHLHKEKLNDDFILDPIMGLIIADRHREFFLTEGNQTDFNFYQAIITFPEKEQEHKSC